METWLTILGVLCTVLLTFIGWIAVTLVQIKSDVAGLVAEVHSNNRQSDSLKDTINEQKAEIAVLKEEVQHIRTKLAVIEHYKKLAE